VWQLNEKTDAVLDVEGQRMQSTATHTIVGRACVGRRHILLRLPAFEASPASKRLIVISRGRAKPDDETLLGATLLCIQEPVALILRRSLDSRRPESACSFAKVEIKGFVTGAN
jgi:hypothetical protein